MKVKMKRSSLGFSGKRYLLRASQTLQWKRYSLKYIFERQLPNQKLPIVVGRCGPCRRTISVEKFQIRSADDPEGVTGCGTLPYR